MRIVIDVGASTGLFANFIANKSVRVFAIEPIQKSTEEIG